MGGIVKASLGPIDHRLEEPVIDRCRERFALLGFHDHSVFIPNHHAAAIAMENPLTFPGGNPRGSSLEDHAQKYPIFGQHSKYSRESEAILPHLAAFNRIEFVFDFPSTLYPPIPVGGIVDGAGDCRNAEGCRRHLQG